MEEERSRQEAAPGSPDKIANSILSRLNVEGGGEMLIEVVGLGVRLGSHCHPAIVAPS